MSDGSGFPSNFYTLAPGCSQKHATGLRVQRCTWRRRIHGLTRFAKPFLLETLGRGKPLTTLASERGTARKPNRDRPVYRLPRATLLAHEEAASGRMVHSQSPSYVVPMIVNFAHPRVRHKISELSTTLSYDSERTHFSRSLKGLAA
jgi:hypothetical protein